MAMVLAVDDEPQILTALGRGLKLAGHEVIVARNGLDGLTTAAAARPDVILLDLRLPDLDGIEVTRRLRAWTNVPILLLSGVGTVRARIMALDAGADDFLEKPFSMEELRARIGALLRRSSRLETAERPTKGPRLSFGQLTVDLSSRTVEVGSEPVRLTPMEWRLLEALVTNSGKLLTHAFVIAAVWSDRHGDESREALRAHLRSLRRRLGDDASAPRYILTEPGVGYRWIGDRAGDGPG